MARDSGDEVRVARLGDVGSIPGPAARRAAARWNPVAAEGGGAARVAAFPAPDVEDAPGGPAAVVDLTSVSRAPAATVAADLAAAPARPDEPARTARLGETTRGGGRARRRPDDGSAGEPPTRRRSRVPDRPGPRTRPTTSADLPDDGPAPSTDDPTPADGPAPADGTAPDADRASRPPRRSGPRQIDPDADPVSAAREICLRLLTDRARTRHELAQALSRRGVPDDAATSVLERFDDVGLIDDAAFAGQFVRSRHDHRGLARRAIAMELRRKGVDDEVAAEALEDVDAESESRRARELVDRKLRSLTVETPEQRTSAARRLVGMLARKGYGAGTAYGVVREALAAHGADPDELGTTPADD